MSETLKKVIEDYQELVGKSVHQIEAEKLKAQLQVDGFTTSLKEFLNIYFPQLKLFVPMDNAEPIVWLPGDPALPKAEKAVDEAWEHNRI